MSNAQDPDNGFVPLCRVSFSRNRVFKETDKTTVKKRTPPPSKSLYLYT